MHKHLLLFLVSFSLFNLSASAKVNTDSFEGSINLLRESVFDTTHITIMVKGSLARVDEVDKDNRLVSRRLIDLEKNTVVALSPQQKLYTNLQVSNLPKVNRAGVEVRKTENYKEINGYKCYQWRVKDVQRNTEVAFWVANESFEFFEQVIQLLNRTEQSLTLYQVIPENDGFFPMLTEERTLLRKEKLKISVVDISRTNLSAKLFEIPEGYQSLRQ